MSVVPITGKPFVHPFAAPRSASPTSSRFSTSPSSESGSSFGGSASPSTSSDAHDDDLIRARSYAAGLRAHTQAMWEAERVHIERVRLEAARAGSASPVSPSCSSAQAASATAVVESPKATHARKRSDGLFRSLTGARGRRRNVEA